jgi:transposase-like protein
MMPEGGDAETGVSRGELVVMKAVTDLMRDVLQTGLEVELTEHLGYEPHERGRCANNAQ